MSDLVKREITELAPNGSNYLSWSIDAEIVLDGKNLLHTIKPSSVQAVATSAERAQALHFLRHHISSSLKNEYMTERDPLVLWKALNERFEKVETVLLPRMKREWQNLRFQDYKTVEEYNAKLYGIVTRLKLCGMELTEAELIEKTLSTFHPKATYLSRQYKKEKYKKYIDLSNALQQDQGEDEELIQNHLSRPTGSLSTHEANAVSSSKKNEGKGKGPKKAPWKGGAKSKNFKKNRQGKSKKIPPGGEYGKQDQDCYRCGMRGHWSKICRTPKHLVEMYRQLKGQLQEKEKKEHEAHFVSTKITELGDPSNSKEPESPKYMEEKKDDSITDDGDAIMKNLEDFMDTDDGDDLLGEELEDAHGDSV
jgi:gag-polypeptide of LTR copia-type